MVVTVLFVFMVMGAVAGAAGGSSDADEAAGIVGLIVVLPTLIGYGISIGIAAWWRCAAVQFANEKSA